MATIGSMGGCSQLYLYFFNMVRFKTCKTMIHLLFEAKTVETVY